MATTTNYGWTTPDDTALVKDGASAIRTLGSSIDTTTKNLNPETTLGDIAYRSSSSNTNTRLAIGSSGQVLTVAAGVPSWATPTDQTPLTTKGDLFTFSTVDARVGVGANGTVLTADSAEATGLKWQAPAGGGGKVLQVVYGSTSTSVQTASATYSDTGLSASITPSLNTSKVLVLVNQTECFKGGDTRMRMKLLRGGTDILQIAQNLGNTNSGLTDHFGSVTCSYLDAPATTSATTYKTQFNNQDATGNTYVQGSGTCTSTIILMEIGA